MLIQIRESGLRLVRQHDHGLLAGELARAWRGVPAVRGSGAPGGGQGVGGDGGIGTTVPPDDVLVLATALHDLAWRSLDEPPRWNPETGRPQDFLSFPPAIKYAAAAEAIDRLADLHPYAAVLVSLHYTGFGSPGRPVEFEDEEETRRMELLDALGEDAPGPRKIRRDLETLRLFDNLSLFICLTPPGADPAGRPGWLREELLAVPEGGPRLRLEWIDEATVSLDPFPFGEDALALDLPYRDLATGRFPDQEALERAWAEAEDKQLGIRVTDGGQAYQRDGRKG